MLRFSTRGLQWQKPVLVTLLWLSAALIGDSAILPAAELADGRVQGAAQSATLEPLTHRFAPSNELRVDVERAPTAEVPDFQRHVSPLLGRLGCNGRAWGPVCWRI